MLAAGTVDEMVLGTDITNACGFIADLRRVYPEFCQDKMKLCTAKVCGQPVDRASNCAEQGIDGCGKVGRRQSGENRQNSAKLCDDKRGHPRNNCGRHRKVSACF